MEVVLLRQCSAPRLGGHLPALRPIAVHDFGARRDVDAGAEGDRAPVEADGGVGGTMIDPPDLYDVKHGTCSAS